VIEHPESHRGHGLAAYNSRHHEQQRLCCPPLRIGEFYPSEIGGVKVGREAASVYTYPFNMTGQPAATVPCGFTKAGLPIGLQIVGRRYDDVTVLRAGGVRGGAPVGAAPSRDRLT
jgi:hypothetical protein